MRHCASCNKSESESKFYGEFCEECAKKRLADKLPDKAELRICKKCGMIFAGSAFQEPLGKAMQLAISQRIKGYQIRLMNYDNEKALVEIGKATSDGLLAVERELRFTFDKVQCEKCTRISSGYYEATIQLRGSDEKVRRLRDRIVRYMGKNSAFITKINEVDNGIDIYISEKRAAGEMILHMRLEAIRSYTLYGLKGGRRVYRDTYAIHV